MVWVTGGQLFVTDPAGNGGKAPTITPCPGIELIVNGNKVEDKTSVSEKDVVVIKPGEEKRPGTFLVRVTPGGLTAVLEVKVIIESRHFVQDSEPVHDLALKAAVLQEKRCPFNLAEIMQEMNRKNIVHGVKHMEIQGILSNPEDGIYIIAEGDHPGDPVDENIEFLFPTEQMNHQLIVDSEKVNFRDLFEIFSIDSGDLLAVKHCGVQGNPGRTVTGELIPPAAPRSYELSGGKAVEISPDGNKAVAKTGGRPFIRRNGNRYVIDIEPVYNKKGDVDISSGNVRFKGDVVVHGNVYEGMTVQAAGKVNILGLIFEAGISSQDNITVMRNITGSNLVAGGSISLLKAVNDITEKLQAELTEMVAMIPQLALHPKLKDVRTGQLVQFLIDKKFPSVPVTVNELVKYIEKNAFSLPGETMELKEKLKKNLLGLNLLKLESLEVIESLLSEMHEVKALMGLMAGKKADIKFGYAINSKIEATGDIHVEGRGCINTLILAGGDVRINGVFRGGEVTAKGDIFVNEAGSELGVKTVIKAGSDGRVYIKKAFEGVTIQIGERKTKINFMQNNIKAELDEVGNLVVYSVMKT